MRMISEDGHHTRAMTFCVVRVTPMADSRTERLRILLTVSPSHLYVPHLAVVDVE